MSESDVQKAVIACGEAAEAAAPGLAAAPDNVINEALRGMAALLPERAAEVLAANATDMAEGEVRRSGPGAAGPAPARRGPDRQHGCGSWACSPMPRSRPGQCRSARLPGGLQLAERRVPVGVIGANFEARPNVTVDVASQLLKSRNAGVLRTGGAALRSAAALADHVIAPVRWPRLDPGCRAAGPVRGPDRRGRAGPPARPDPAGHRARQRGHHPQPGRRGGPARGTHARPCGRRRGALPGPGGRPGAGRRAHHREPGPAGRVQPAEPAADCADAWDRAAGARAGHAARPAASPRPCRRTTTRWATSGRWTPATRPP